MEMNMSENNTEKNTAEIDYIVDESLFDKESPEFKHARENCIKAKDTVEDTYAELNSKRTMSQNGLGMSSGCVDIDDAKWNKEYQQRGDKNLELLKSLGLYKQLQDMGIVYDAKQFRKLHNVQSKTTIPLGDGID